MDRAKEAIAHGFRGVKKQYEKVYEIIDARWSEQLHRPLHAAGHVLNPGLYYKAQEEETLAKSLWTEYIACVEKLVHDTTIPDALVAELPKYKMADGLFGCGPAKRARDTRSPVEWWSLFGSETPNLQKFAMKVLSLTCSSSGCERNWSVFEHVLSKIVSVAFKYHFRMPPYFTLLLRSLASLEGLAVAGDPSFKTFEAAFPYVVRKLLSDNSVASRKILHSVVLNRNKEFQWQKLALFLRAAANRKGLNTITASNPQASLSYLNTIMAPNPQVSLAYSSDGASGVFDVANLVLRILPSKDGIVLRRLLMTADGASLVRAFISKEAMFFRQHLCRIVAAILSQWIFEALGSNVISSQMQLTGALNAIVGPSSAVFSRDYDCKSTLRDRRLKLILFKVLGSARKRHILMMRFLCSSCLIFIKATAVACHRFLVCLSMAYLDRESLAPREVVVGA